MPEPVTTNIKDVSPDEVLLNLEEILYSAETKPEITLEVNGKPITFLCDSGACRTTCKELFPNCKTSGENAFVRSAHGDLALVPESEPTWIRDPKGESCQLTVLLIKWCPVNLLGRDGMIKLGIALVPTPDGRLVIKRRSELQKGDIFVLQGIGQPHYYYSLDIPNKPPTSTGSALMAEGRQAILNEQDKMSENELHVTLWYKTSPGPDPHYEAKLKKLTPTIFTVNYVYSDAQNTAVAGVTLKEDVDKLYRQYVPPHISLYKNKNQQWKDLGKIVQQGEAAEDWVATSVNTWASASTGLTKKALFWSVLGQEGVHLQTPLKREED